MLANKRKNATAGRWHKISDALVAAEERRASAAKRAALAKKERSALARARWARAIKSVMEAIAAKKNWNKIQKQLTEFAVALVKVLALLALAYFLVCGGQQKVSQRTETVPTLADGIEFEHMHTPALGYTEPKVTKALKTVKPVSEPKVESSSTQIATIPVHREGGWGFIAILILATMMI